MNVIKWHPPYHRSLPDGKLQQMFLPELMPIVVSALKRHNWGDDWEMGNEGLREQTLAACCLVCHEWCRLFSPLLYAELILDGAFNDASHLYHPRYKKLIKKLTIDLRLEYHIQSVWTLLSSNMPNLCELVIEQFDHSKFHPRLAQCLRSLSRRCNVILCPPTLPIKPKLIPGWFRFLRSSQPSSCNFTVNFEGSDTRGRSVIRAYHLDLALIVALEITKLRYATTFWVGKCRINLHGKLHNGPAFSSFISGLTQVSHPLYNLSLRLGKDSVSFPGGRLSFTIRRLFILMKPSSYKSPSKPTSSLGRHLLGALRAGRSRHEQSRETMAQVFFPESDIPIPGDQDPAFRTTSGGRDDRKDGGDTTHRKQEDHFIEYLSRYVLRRKVHTVPEIV